MALTTEQLVLQADILASKTDSNTNPNMVFKSVEAMNKGLNPAYFSGNKTKIVNAINTLAVQNSDTANLVADLGNKTNSVLMDVSGEANELIWSEVQKLLGQPTIIQGLKYLLEANRQEQILGLKPEDVGKVLSVDRDTEGNLITKAIDAVTNGVVATDVEYTNEAHPEITTVAQAIDFLFANGATTGPVTWDDIKNKPQLADSMVLTPDALVLKSGDVDLSTIAIVGDVDIENIFSGLNSEK